MRRMLTSAEARFAAIAGILLNQPTLVNTAQIITARAAACSE